MHAVCICVEVRGWGGVGGEGGGGSACLFETPRVRLNKSILVYAITPLPSLPSISPSPGLFISSPLSLSLSHTHPVAIIVKGWTKEKKEVYEGTQHTMKPAVRYSFIRRCQVSWLLYHARLLCCKRLQDTEGGIQEKGGGKGKKEAQTHPVKQTH